MYKIFLDKSKTFECDINIEGASLKESEVRLYLEAENFFITLTGNINENGEVKIPIQKLKGILKENHKGKIYLEVIAEDTRFIPWESEYKTDISKKVSLKMSKSISEAVEPEIIKEEKPKISFKLKEEEFLDVSDSLNAIQEILHLNKIDYKLFRHNQPILNELIETYCKENSIDDPKYINEIKKQMLNIIK